MTMSLSNTDQGRNEWTLDVQNRVNKMMLAITLNTTGKCRGGQWKGRGNVPVGVGGYFFKGDTLISASEEGIFTVKGYEEFFFMDTSYRDVKIKYEICATKWCRYLQSSGRSSADIKRRRKEIAAAARRIRRRRRVEAK